VKGATLPVLIDFWAPWCAPCRAIGPVIEQIASEMEGKLLVGKVNVDENPKISAQFRIQAIPAVFIFQNGEVKEKVVGLVSKADLLAKIAHLQSAQ
jgi:thioredoxin 1